MEGADVPVETSKGEWGRGQEEINLRYAEALEMADRTALYKHGAKEIAYQHGSAITFMAKYDMAAAGSSFHLHSSLWDKTGTQAPVRRRRQGITDDQAPRCSASGWRPAGDGARARVLLRAGRELLQALSVRIVRAHAHRGRLGQPDVRLPAVR
jgi:hypothetical protein